MMKSIFLSAGTLVLGCVLPTLSGTLHAADEAPLNEGQRFYIEKIRPIFSQKCYKCHTDMPNSHFRVDSREAILEGGKRGPAIVPGDPDNSLLIQAVRQTGELKMPKDSRLEDQEIADLIAWVKMGAPWDPQDHAKPVIPVLSAAAAASSVGEDFFESKIRPIFANICSQCHGDTATSGLRVFSRETLLQGGHRGPAIVPNDPEKSLLIQAVRQTGDLKMPKGGKLPAEDVQNLAEWVRMGAPWPQSKPVLASGPPFKITPEQRAFWSFQPIKLPATPVVKNARWAKTDIDRFVLAKMESQGNRAIARCRPAYIDPARHVRPDGAAAYSGGD